MAARILIIGVVALVSLGYSNTLLWAQGPERSVSELQALQRQLNRIKAFGASRDLAGLERAVNGHLEAWKQGRMDDYGNMMLTAVQTLASEPFGDNRQYELAQHYARICLEKAGRIPLEAEVRLVRHIEADFVMPSAPKGEEWAQQRTADLKLWFQAWKRVHDAIDPRWNPNDLPQANVAPPPAAQMPAGVVPEAIKNPRLRAEYEAAIAANQRKAERYNQQYVARKLKKRFFPKAERYIIAAYSRPPFNMKELQRNLMRYVPDTVTRKKITDAVETNMRSATE
jgi:hypothetical protein